MKQNDLVSNAQSDAIIKEGISLKEDIYKKRKCFSLRLQHFKLHQQEHNQESKNRDFFNLNMTVQYTAYSV